MYLCDGYIDCNLRSSILSARVWSNICSLFVHHAVGRGGAGAGYPSLWTQFLSGGEGNLFRNSTWVPPPLPGLEQGYPIPFPWPGPKHCPRPRHYWLWTIYATDSTPPPVTQEDFLVDILWQDQLENCFHHRILWKRLND